MTGLLDVIVKIGGAGVCRTDLHIIEEQWAEKSGVQLPYTIGHENAGWVEAVGPRSPTRRGRHGDPPPHAHLRAVPACRRRHALRPQQLPRHQRRRGNGRVPVTSARACVKLQPTTRPEDVAALADAGITAYHAVRKAVPLLYPGTVAVVVGAGGLGHIGIQCLAAMTATTIVVVDRNPAAELAGKLGADHTVVADGSHVDAVLDLTDGQGAEVVLDFAAEQGAQQEGFAMTRRGGSQYIIGYGSNIDIPTIDIISTERNVVGNLVGTYNDLAELMVLAQAGKVTLHTKTYPLADAPKALADLDAGRVRGWPSSSPDGRGQTGVRRAGR